MIALPVELLSLNLECNNIEESGLRNLCSALTSPSIKLQHLSLSNNFLHYSGCKTLVASLIENTSLRTLGLAQNFIKDQGAECIGFLLGLETCLLEEINLSDNFICAKGAYAIYSIFESGDNRNIKKVDLRKNEIHELTSLFKNYNSINH